MSSLVSGIRKLPGGDSSVNPYAVLPAARRAALWSRRTTIIVPIPKMTAHGTQRGSDGRTAGSSPFFWLLEGLAPSFRSPPTCHLITCILNSQVPLRAGLCTVLWSSTVGKAEPRPHNRRAVGHRPTRTQRRPFSGRENQREESRVTWQ